MTKVLTKIEHELYDSLSDQRSKEVFMARKYFAETGVADFISVFEGRSLKPLTEIWKRLDNKVFVCYGAGDGCHKFLTLIKEKGLSQNCCAVFDSNSVLHGRHISGQVITKFDAELANRADIIVITAMFYSISDEIHNYLLGLGIEESKILLFSDYFAHNDIDLYFDWQMLKGMNEEEIFVDGGCLDFKTSMLFLKHCPNAKKIYAIEPNKEQLDVIKRNIRCTGYSNVRVVNGALWSSDTKLSFAVSADKSASHVTTDCLFEEKTDAYALDNIVENGDKVTFIKMDIEGAELDALKGAENIIKRDKPKMAISLYHKPLDYIYILNYIKSIVPEYQMILRHYTTSETETVLYCYR